MKLLILVVSALLVSALAGPTRRGKPQTSLKSFLGVMAAMKKPETYAMLEDMSKIYAMSGEMLQHADPNELSDEDKKTYGAAMKIASKMGELHRILAALGKATLVEGAHPSDEELANLAKELAKAYREHDMTIRQLDIPDALMTKETIAALKAIVEENPLKESGNDYLAILKEKLPRIFTVANRIRNVDRHVKKLIKERKPLEKLPATDEEKEEMLHFVLEFIMDEAGNMLKSDETVISLFKSFGVLTNTLKTASSYNSLRAFYDAIARSKRLEAYAIIIRENFKCMGEALTAEEKAEFHQHIGNVLNVAKVLIADGQDTSKLEEMIEAFEENDDPVLTRLSEKVEAAYKTPEGKLKYRQCLVKDADRQAFKEAIAIGDAVYSEEQLATLKQKNEKVYAVVYLLNGIVRAVRKREGLGAEADAFLKEMVTMPNTLLRVADFFSPSEETAAKIVAQRKVVIEKYNSMSAEAKKQFVDLFPYRTILNLALLD